MNRRTSPAEVMRITNPRRETGTARKVPGSQGAGRQSVIGRNAKAARRTASTFPVHASSRPPAPGTPSNPSPATRAHPLAAILLAVVGVLAGKNCHTLPGDQAAWALPATHVAAAASGPGRGLAHNLGATDLRTPSAPPPTPSPANLAPPPKEP